MSSPSGRRYVPELPHTGSAIEPYVVALAAVVLATVARAPFEGWLLGRAPYALFYLPVLFVGWRYGLVPTVFTTFLGLVAAWFAIVPEPYTFEHAAKEPGYGPSMVMYLVASSAMIVLSRKAAELRQTARRTAEELRVQREWLETTLSSIGDGVIATDARGNVSFMNPVAEALTGWRRQDATGKQSAEVFRIVNETTREPVVSPIERVLQEGTIVGLANHTVLIAADGSERAIDDSGAPIRNGDGRIVGAVLVFRDVSGRRADEQELRVGARERERLLESERAARAEAERANRIKDEFVATLSHELRNPLNAILGWLGVLKSGAADAQTIAQAHEIIERNARLQAQLVSDLLDTSSILSGKIRLHTEIVELQPLLDATLDTIRLAAEAKRIVIERDFVATPPVLGDPARLQQVLWNLLSNAVKFTPSMGRVSLSLREVDGSAEIAVTDTGIGIPAEQLPHVFERFRQGDGSVTRKFGGLGLGLGIVRQLAELHGGTVIAESAGEGRGATFRLRLPLAERGPGPRKGGGEGALGGERLRGLNLLVVEDQDDTREFIVRMLEEYGAHVWSAQGGNEALALLELQHPDVLVCDIGMPEVDGYTLVERIRRHSDPRVARLPAIALTAFARSADRARAFDAGFQAHLAKPADPAELVATIASFAEPNPPEP